MSSPAVASKRRYLYIAKEQGGPADEFKSGRTRQRPRSRMQGMGGQTDRVFELLELFETWDELTAENKAFEILDSLGVRKYPGTRKELFVGEYAVIRAACLAGCRYADSLYEQRGLHKVDAALAAMEPPAATVVAKTSFWNMVLQAPVALDGKTQSLGVLLERADKSPAALRRVERLGVLRMARSAACTELKVVWHQAAWLVEWLKANRQRLPRAATSVFEVSHAR